MMSDTRPCVCGKRMIKRHDATKVGKNVVRYPSVWWCRCGHVEAVVVCPHTDEPVWHAAWAAAQATPERKTATGIMAQAAEEAAKTAAAEKMMREAGWEQAQSKQPEEAEDEPEELTDEEIEQAIGGQSDIIDFHRGKPLENPHMGTGEREPRGPDKSEVAQALYEEFGMKHDPLPGGCLTAPQLMTRAIIDLERAQIAWQEEEFDKVHIKIAVALDLLGIALRHADDTRQKVMEKTGDPDFFKPK